MSNDKKNNSKNGFTIIEMVIVMAVFMFVIGAAIAIFISIVSHQKKVLGEDQLLSQISYAQEYISKSMRMAKKSETSQDLLCIPSGYVFLLTRPTNEGVFEGIKFISQEGDDSSGNPIYNCEEFFLDHYNAGDETSPLVLKELKNSSDTNDAVDLTSEGLQINSMRFAVNGSDGTVSGTANCSDINLCGASDSDANQPRVTMLLSAQIAADSQNPVRIFQTTISQRNLEAK